MTNVKSFLWAAFGAIIPEVLRFFKIAASGSPLPQLAWGLYVGLLLLYFVSAGLFSVAWKPESEFKAIWVGASFPALVAALLQTPPKP